MEGKVPLIIIPPSQRQIETGIAGILVPDNAMEILELLMSPIAGIFAEIKHMRTFNGSFYERNHTRIRVGTSVAYEDDGKRWIHISMSHRKRMPTHDEMLEVKNFFIGDDRYAMQVFPPKDMYVNQHPFCLHLWHCLDGHPLPEFSHVFNGKRQV